MQTTPINTPEPAAVSAETWAIVDLFGHVKIAGRLSEHQVGGQSFVRIDVPEVTGRRGPIPAHTRLFGGAAIYSIAFVDQGTATLAARDILAAPVSMWSLQNAIEKLPQAERARFLGIDMAAPGADQTAHGTYFSDYDPEA